MWERKGLFLFSLDIFNESNTHMQLKEVTDNRTSLSNTEFPLQSCATAGDFLFSWHVNYTEGGMFRLRL